MQALPGFVSEARWLRYAGGHLRHLFPYLPGQSGYNKRVRKLAATMCWLIRMLACDTSLWGDDVWLVDSTRSSAAGRRRLYAARTWPDAPDTATAPLIPAISGAAAAPAVHASRPARQFRAHRRHSRRA